MNTFGAIISRAACSNLSIEYYFDQKGMSQFVPILAKERILNMDNLICVYDDEKDEEQFNEIMDLIKDGMDEQHIQWEKDKVKFESDPKNKDKTYDKAEPPKKLLFGDKTFLKNVCYKPEKWQKEQEDMEKATKVTLNKVSPVLAQFFTNIHSAIKQAQLILSYSNVTGELTAEQQKAIETASIHDDKKDNNKNDNKVDDNCDNKQMDVHVPPNEDEQKELNLKLMQQFDIYGQKVFEHSVALNKAAILGIHVVEDMSDEFKGSLQAFGFAQSIQGTCMEIIRSIGQIRQSLLLAQAILKMKPSNLTDKSKLLWNSVDNGIIGLFRNALELSKVSSKYFGFFLKFQQSLCYYQDAIKADSSLLVSTEYLQKDIKEFNQLSNEFSVNISKLNV